MMNIYNGNVVTDGSGTAIVTMPDWFDALNRDFRYQLTVIGQQFAQSVVSSEISNRSFTIRTDRPNIKVSWMVTGIRQDAWANAHRIPVEEEKAEKDKGQYLHPELLGHAGERSIGEPKNLKRKSPRSKAQMCNPIADIHAVSTNSSMESHMQEITVAVRRMHDTGRSGWWLWEPVINFIFLCLGSERRENGYRANPLAAELPRSALHGA